MVPNLSAEKFEALIMASNAFKKDSEKVKFLWDKIKNALYSIDTKHRSLGLGEKVRLKNYFSRHGLIVFIFFVRVYLRTSPAIAP